MADLTKDEAREKLYIRAAERMFNLVPNNGSSPKKVVDDVLSARPEVLAAAMGGRARTETGRHNLLGNWCPGPGVRTVIELPWREADGEGKQ